jgi:hypothetical protein
MVYRRRIAPANLNLEPIDARSPCRRQAHPILGCRHERRARPLGGAAQPADFTLGVAVVIREGMSLD